MTHFYVVIDLGMLPSGNSSSAAAINDLGQVVGSSEVAGRKDHSSSGRKAPCRIWERSLGQQ
jgi:uncharacterized membrane protein